MHLRTALILRDAVRQQTGRAGACPRRRRNWEKLPYPSASERSLPLQLVHYHWIAQICKVARADEGIRPYRFAICRWVCAKSDRPRAIRESPLQDSRIAVRFVQILRLLGLRAIAPTRSVRHRWIDIKFSHARAGTETRPYNN